VSKRLKWIFGLVLAVVIIEELCLPWLVSSCVTLGMAEILATERVTVSIEKRPALAMVAGLFDRIAVKTENAKVDKINFAEFDVVLTDVKLDAQALIGRRQLVVQSAGDAELTAVLTQEELSRFLNQAVKGVKNAVVTVSDNQVKVNGDFGLSGIASVAVTLEGRIIADGQKIKFVTDRFLINNTLVGKLGGAALTEVVLADLKKLPFGVTVRTISMDNGKVTVYADNRVN